MIAARMMPAGDNLSSGRMFVSYGRNISIPSTVSALSGACNLSSGRLEIQRAFGIGDVTQEAVKGRERDERVSVRHITPYMYLSKNVVDSENLLFYGLDNKNRAEDLIASMPYFLGATDEKSISIERRIRQLKKALDIEAAKLAERDAGLESTRQKARSLILEAVQIGIAAPPKEDASLGTLVNQLEVLSKWKPGSSPAFDDSELAGQYQIKAQILSAISDLRRQRRIALETSQHAEGFSGTVGRQLGKVSVIKSLKSEVMDDLCPVCLQASKEPTEAMKTITEAAKKLENEQILLDQYRPRINAQIGLIEDDLAKLAARLREVDYNISQLLEASERTKQLAEASQRAILVVGRISYFLENLRREADDPSVNVQRIRDEIDSLLLESNPEMKEIRLRKAESEISDNATNILERLPIEAPLVGATMQFMAKKPDVSFIEKSGRGRIIRFEAVGSDQNYLAIHIALTFGMHRYIAKISAPVPGVVLIDQVSRPYFPSEQYSDEVELGEEQDRDEDTVALKRHFDFLFSEVGRQEGMQVIVLEHAYFADDPRYVRATKQRWTKASGEKLIPTEWPSLTR
ncbi:MULTISPECIES: DUF3732 domain-containing protein [unclassified Azospirillum]|uniref:DUF3732 domain-containing protein n=1 Tax=unclassified Azospirillum TaxID=2630922 RepID=UPI0013047FDA|nr:MULTISPECIES: DUF3732 domain-containing protein [unclassified Azospirillum]